MNYLRYALLSVSLLALNAVAMDVSFIENSEGLLTTVSSEVGEEVTEATNETTTIVAEPVKSVFGKASDVVVSGYKSGASAVSKAADKANVFLGDSVNFVVEKTGRGTELVAAHPAAAKATLVGGAAAAVTGVSYGTYKLYRYFFPAEQA